MENNKNAYEIIGTNKNVINRISDENEQNRFIEEKAYEKIKRLQLKIERITIILQNSDRKEERIKIRSQINALEKEIEKVKKAYQEIFDKRHRENYNAVLEVFGLESFKEYKPSKETLEKIREKRNSSKSAYEILYISREECDDKIKSSRYIDEKLKKRRDGIIELLKNEYEGKIDENSEYNFSEKQKYKLQVAIINEAYEKISTKEKRKEYDIFLRKMKEERHLKEKYDRSQLYDEKTIHKLGFKQKEKEKYLIIYRNNGHKITIRNIGTIGYIDTFGIKEIEQYEVIRNLGGKTIKENVYTNLNLVDLGVDKNGNYINKKYYNFVANHLLSDESIEQCLKYNNGYVGEAILNSDGKYIQSLSDGQEISAIFKYVKKTKNKEIEEKEEGNEYGE